MWDTEDSQWPVSHFLLDMQCMNSRVNDPGAAWITLLLVHPLVKALPIIISKTFQNAWGSKIVNKLICTCIKIVQTIWVKTTYPQYILDTPVSNRNFYWKFCWYNVNVLVISETFAIQKSWRAVTKFNHYVYFLTEYWISMDNYPLIFCVLPNCSCIMHMCFMNQVDRYETSVHVIPWSQSSRFSFPEGIERFPSTDECITPGK